VGRIDRAETDVVIVRTREIVLVNWLAGMATEAKSDLHHLISSDDSYEVIDPNFDDSYYSQLRGVATADYIPLEEGEVFLRKGLSSYLWEFASVVCVRVLVRSVFSRRFSGRLRSRGIYSIIGVTSHVVFVWQNK